MRRADQILEAVETTIDKRKYRTLVTNIGKAKIARAVMTGEKVMSGFDKAWCIYNFIYVRTGNKTTIFEAVRS